MRRELQLGLHPTLTHLERAFSFLDFNLFTVIVIKYRPQLKLDPRLPELSALVSEKPSPNSPVFYDPRGRRWRHVRRTYLILGVITTGITALFIASVFSGAGWGAMSAAAVNGIVSPWFVRARPAALGMAYNGASIGGMIFSPLWVMAIAALGFPNAATLVAVAMGATMWVLADQLFSRTPQQMGVLPDGDSPGVPALSVKSPTARPLPGARLWHDRKFLTLAAGMAFGLFAQIGLTAHLFSLLVPALGAPRAGMAMATMTGMAIAGRILVGWVMPLSADRRLLAALGYAAQLLGSLVFICADGTSVPLLLLGVILFGVGFGNATSLPPLVAQTEFVERDMQRVVALIVGMSQAAYAFAPALFGLVREVTGPAAGAAMSAGGSGAAAWVFAAAAVIQGLAIAAFLLGRGERH